ncbi:MAG: hypothetical protein AAFQ98_17230 [Bacteroidota bacterium]
MCATWSRSIQRTFEDLTSLEVNTIIKPTIDSGKVDDRDFLLLYQLAGVYYAKITELGKRYERLLPADFSEPDLRLPGIRENNFFIRNHIFEAGGIFSFRELSVWARFGSGFIANYGEQLSNPPMEQMEDMNMLNRIDSLCGTFSQIIETEVEELNLKEKTVIQGPVEGKPKVIDILWNAYKELHEQYRAEWKDHIADHLEQKNALVKPGKEKTSEVMNVYYPLVPGPNRPEELGGGPWRATPFEDWSDITLLRSAQSRVWNLERRYVAAHQAGLYNVKEESREEYYKSFKKEERQIKLDLRDWVFVRKMLDIGTEVVVMQTRIGIDGDITTRIAQRFADRPVQFILDMHNDGINMSVRFWEKIVDTLQSMVSGLMSGNRKN